MSRRMGGIRAAGLGPKRPLELLPDGPGTQSLTIVASTIPGAYVLDVSLKTPAGQTLPPVVLDVTVTA